MKKKQLRNLHLNKKVISTLDSDTLKGGETMHGGPCPGSVGGPCTSIQIPCTYEDHCLITLNNDTCNPPRDVKL